MLFKSLTFAVLVLLIPVVGLPAAAADAGGPVTVPVGQAAPYPVSQTIHLGTYHVATGELVPPEGSEDSLAGFEPIWSVDTLSGFFLPANNTSEERINIGDLPNGTVIGRFTVGFTTDSSDPIVMSIAFYRTNGNNTQTGLLTRLNGADAVYNITVGNLMGGSPTGYTVTVDLTGGNQLLISGPDVDSDGATDWGWGLVFTDHGNSTLGCSGAPCIGGRIASPTTPPGAPGLEDFWDQYDPAAWLGGPYEGTFDFGGVLPATFFLTLERQTGFIAAIPTLSEVGLGVLVLALASLALVMLRRRRPSA